MLVRKTDRSRRRRSEVDDRRSCAVPGVPVLGNARSKFIAAAGVPRGPLRSMGCRCTCRRLALVLRSVTGEYLQKSEREKPNTETESHPNQQQHTHTCDLVINASLVNSLTVAERHLCDLVYKRVNGRKQTLEPNFIRINSNIHTRVILL